MKKNISLLFALVLAVSTVKAQWFVGSKDVKDDVVLKFGVISDTHFENNMGEGAQVKVPQAVRNLTAHGPLEALFVVGDVTNNGEAAQYEMVASAFLNDENYNTRVGKNVFMMGNHDNYSASGQQNFMKGLAPLNGGEDYPLDQYLEIGGYPFITISQRDGGAVNVGASGYPQEVREQLRVWLAKAAEDYPGKPIFVFTHVPPTNTMYSSWTGEGEWRSAQLNSVLNQFPQVILFSGHSHFPMGDPRSIHQGVSPMSGKNNYFTAINTGSTTYTELEPGVVDAGIHPKFYEYVTEGLIVSVKQNGDVLVQRYDTYRDEEIGVQSRWLIEAPHDGSKFKYADVRDAADATEGQVYRTGMPAPEWSEDVEELATSYDALAGKLTISFPQAQDEEYVFRYVAEFRNPYGRLVDKQSIYSFAYLNSDMPEELSVSFNCSGLPSGDYYLEVKAYDAFGNESEYPLFSSVELEDGAAAEAPEPDGLWDFEDVNNLTQNSIEGSPYTLETGVCGSRSYSLEDIEVTSVIGPQSGDNAIALKAGEMFKLNLGTQEEMTSYTIGWYISVADFNVWRALLQNNTENLSDANLFINKNGQVGRASDRGMGYGGQLVFGKWHQIVLSVDNKVGTLYLDGETIVEGTSSDQNIVSDCILLFADENGEYGDINVAQIAFWNRALTSAEAKAFSAVEGDYLETSTKEITVSEDMLQFDVVISSSVYPKFELPEWIHEVDALPGVGRNLVYTFACDKMDEAGTRSDFIVVKGSRVNNLYISVTQMRSGDIMDDAAAIWNFNNEQDILGNTGKELKFEVVPVMLNSGSSYPVVRESLEEAGISVVAGVADDDKALQIPKGSGLKVTFPLGELYKNYTIVWDLMYFYDEWTALFQTNANNSNDADFFIKGSTHQIGLSGWYGGETKTNTWHRIVLVVRDGAPTAYLDGEKTGSSEYAGKYEVDGGCFYLFMDEDGEDNDVRVTNVSFFDNALNDGQVAKLGKIDVENRYLGVNASEFNVKDDELQFYLNISSSGPFKFELPEWIKSIGQAPIAGDNITYTFLCDVAEEGEKRTGEIRIIPETDGIDEVVVTVTQENRGNAIETLKIGDWTFADESNPMKNIVSATDDYDFTMRPVTYEGTDITECATLADASISLSDGPKAGSQALMVPKMSGFNLYNEAGNGLDTYTLMYDIKYTSTDGYFGLLQLDPRNDADDMLFIRGTEVGKRAYGGSLEPGVWYRIVTVMKDGQQTIYLDGEKIVQVGYYGSIKPEGFNILIDDDAEDQDCYLSRFTIWSSDLTEAQIKQLGKIE